VGPIDNWNAAVCADVSAGGADDVTSEPSPVTTVDYDMAAGDYGRTRTLGTSQLLAWRPAVAPHVGDGVKTIVDVGAGTGQFSIALAQWFQTHVVALEPATGMRQLGRPNASHPAFTSRQDVPRPSRCATGQRTARGCLPLSITSAASIKPQPS
jgi:hypothetical protein